jgi:hypothetical protein
MTPSPSEPPMTRSRAASAGNILEAMLKRARTLVRNYPRFPSLIISAGGSSSPSSNGNSSNGTGHAESSGLVPQGAFAEAQAAYLQPDETEVSAWVDERIIM